MGPVGRSSQSELSTQLGLVEPRAVRESDAHVRIIRRSEKRSLIHLVSGEI